GAELLVQVAGGAEGEVGLTATAGAAEGLAEPEVDAGGVVRHGEPVEVLETRVEDPDALVHVAADGGDARAHRAESGQGGPVRQFERPLFGRPDQGLGLVEPTGQHERVRVEVVPRPVPRLVDVDPACEGVERLRRPSHRGVVTGGCGDLHTAHRGGDDLDRVRVGGGGQVFEVRRRPQVIATHGADDGARPVDHRGEQVQLQLVESACGGVDHAQRLVPLAAEEVC